MSRRLEKINQAILETASSTILFSLRDPRIQNVTVTRVETAPDTRTAKVYVSVLGDETEQRLCLHGLASACGFIQKKVADRIQTRFTPVLEFILDDSIKKSIAASRLIRDSLEDGIPLPGDPLPGNVPLGHSPRAPTAEAANDRTDQTADDASTDDTPETDQVDTPDPTDAVDEEPAPH